MKKIILFTIMLLLLLLIIPPALAIMINLQNGQVKNIGDTAALDLTMDSAPSGLSGLSSTSPSVILWGLQ